MRVARGVCIRGTWKPFVGAAVLGALMIGCGSSTDPDAVTLEELKYANGLALRDQGNGTVRLYWNGMNNEDGFAGYNVYGGKDTDGSLVALEGKSIELLNDKGEPVAEGKASLQKMNYNGKDWETPGATNNAAGDLQVVPFYTTKDGEDPILPSCLPAAADASGNAECKAITTKGGSTKVNSVVWFDVTGVKVGSTYCFTVLAAKDSGKKVALATSNVACIVPRAKVTATALEGLPGSSGTKTNTIDFEALRTACGETGGTACGTLAIKEVTKVTNCATTEAVCLEVFSNKLNLTANGTRAGIQDMGYYPNGFNSANLPPAPALSTYSTVQNKDGYSVGGQSLPLEDKHIYVVAVGTTDNPTKYHYHWLYVSNLKNDTTSNKFTFDAEVRISNKVDAR